LDDCHWTDERLLSELQDPSGRAWKVFVDRFGPRVMGLVAAELRRLGGDAPGVRAEDVFQEVFREFFEKRWFERLRAPAGLRSLLAVLAVSRTVDAVRKEGRLRRWQDEGSAVCKEAAPAADPRGTLRRRHLLEEIERDLEGLPVKEELVIRLAWQQGTHVAWIARLVGVPAEVVEGILERARQEVRRKYGGGGAE